MKLGHKTKIGNGKLCRRSDQKRSPVHPCVCVGSKSFFSSEPLSFTSLSSYSTSLDFSLRFMFSELIIHIQLNLGMKSIYTKLNTLPRGLNHLFLQWATRDLLPSWNLLFIHWLGAFCIVNFLCCNVFIFIEGEKGSWGKGFHFEFNEHHFYSEKYLSSPWRGPHL